MSGLKPWPCFAALAAYSSSSSSAICWTACRTRAFVRTQSCVPSRLSAGCASPGADVAADPVGLVDRDVQAVALRVLEREVVALDAVGRQLDEPEVAGDAVLDVDDVAADVEVGEEGLAARGARPDAARRAFDQPKISRSVRRRKLSRPILLDEREALGERAADEDERARGRSLADVLGGRREQLALLEQLLDPARLASDEDDRLGRLGRRRASSSAALSLPPYGFGEWKLSPSGARSGSSTPPAS